MIHGDKESIRIQGRRLSELPHAQRMEALKQMAENDEAQALTKILSSYPKYDVEQLEGAIRQMEGNIKALQATQVKEFETIKEYRNLICKCEARDQELKARGFVD